MNAIRILALTTVAALGACAVGPDFQRPAAPEVKGYRAAAEAVDGAPQYRAGAEVSATWWQSFQSPALNALIERALQSNPNLDAARAALRAAQELTAAQRGLFLPQIGAEADVTRQKTPQQVQSALNSGASLYTLHTAQLTVGYTLDVFGANRRAVEALQAQSDAQRYELEAARQSIAANVAAAAVQEAALRGQLAALEQMSALQGQTLELTQRRYALGDVAEAAVAAQQTALAQTQAAVPQLRKQLAQTRDLLQALSGALPDQALPESFALDQLQLPAELPLSLPSKLVEQRPDIRAAEAQAHAAAAQVGVATANLLPQLTISANAGSMATQLDDLFKAGNGLWGVAGGITAPIFQGGSLWHRKKAAQALYEQALAQYRATVIAAFQNVADSLHALDQDAALEQATTLALRSAQRSYQIAQRQLELGDISTLALLNAAQAYQQALLQQAQARASRYADVIALYQALGGGWNDAAAD